jgi:hypothetical protein
VFLPFRPNGDRFLLLFVITLVKIGKQAKKKPTKQTKNPKPVSFSEQVFLLLSTFCVA